jgi:hypothetical protein
MKDPALPEAGKYANFPSLHHKIVIDLRLLMQAAFFGSASDSNAAACCYRDSGLNLG